MDPVVCCAWIDAQLANIKTASAQQRRAKKRLAW
jgi:hypothetical protein